MALSIQFFIGRLLGRNENITTAKLNAMVKGMSAALSGSVGTSDLLDGAVTPAKVSQGAYAYAAAILGGNTYTAAFYPAVTGYSDGLALCFKTDVANPGQVNLDAGGGAKPLVKLGGSVMAANDLPAGGMVTVRYNATLKAGGCWEVQSLLSAASIALASNVINPDKVAYGNTAIVAAAPAALDWSLGFVFTCSLTANTNFNFSNAKAGQSIVIVATQDATGGRTVAWTQTIRWRGGVAPTQTTTANKADLYTIAFDGTNYYGSYSQNY